MHAVKLGDHSPLLNNLEMIYSAKSPHKPSIGLHVGIPHFNQGINNIMCEVETSTVSVTSSTTVTWSKVGDLNDVAINNHRKIINDLAETIAELSMQKRRFTKELERLINKEANLDKEAQLRLSQV